jgi:hypothetical protein
MFYRWIYAQAMEPGALGACAPPRTFCIWGKSALFGNESALFSLNFNLHILAQFLLINLFYFYTNYLNQ